MVRLLIFPLAFVCASLVAAAEASSGRITPKHIGNRELVLEFTIDEKGNATDAIVVSSEEKSLDNFAKALVFKGRVKDGALGVTKVGENKYRAVLEFPVAGDEAPLSAEVTLPKARIQPQPNYPLNLMKGGVAGGALLRLSIDKEAHLTNVELVRASQDDFGKAAVEAVKKWQYSQPAKKGPQPIAITLFQLVIFEIEGKANAPWQWQVSPLPAFPEYIVTVMK